MRAVGPPTSLDPRRIVPAGKVDLARESDFAIGAMIVRPSASEVEVAGKTHKLEPRVMQVLAALARAEGAVVSRDDLIQTCWGGLVVGDDAINRVIGRVRRAAALADSPAFRVETIPKIGYRLIPAPSDSVAETRHNSPPAPAIASVAGRPRGPAALPLALGAAVLIGAATLALVGPRFWPTEKTVTVAAPPRLAVLPFDIDGAEADDQAWLAEGIAEEIHNRLAKLGHIEVIGFGSATAVSGVTDDIQELGRRLGATVILQGGFRREGENLSLNFELIDARTGAQMWVDSFEGAVKDVVRIEEEVERAIAGALHIPVPASATGPDISAGNPDAYALYLKGLAAFRRTQTGGEDGAVALLKRAVELDPALTAARARLALAYAMHADTVVRPEGNFAAHARTLSLASETALAALAVEPENAVALTALGAVRMQEKLYKEAETLLNYVREIAPEEEAADIVLAHHLASAGYVDEARAILDGAMALNPAEARIVGPLAAYELLLGDYENALRHGELAYSLKFPPGRWTYTMSMAALGRADEAADTIAAELAAAPSSPVNDWRKTYWREILGVFEGDAGRARYIDSIRERLDRRDPELVYSGAEQILTLLGEAGLRDRLLLYFIDGGYYDRSPLGVSGLWTTEAANVRASPQFKALVVRLRFVPYWKSRGWPKDCRPKGEDDFECG